jgi:putative Holliday junction resolvase
MGRILAIDYGTKKTGLAVTDPLQIIASGLETIPTDGLMAWLERYVKAEGVETIVLGEPLHADGAPAQLHEQILRLKGTLERTFPGVPVVLQDERYTSEEAKRIILLSGAGKKKRQDKTLVDKVSAAIILQAYMQQIGKY